MQISANDPTRKTWVELPDNTDFPIQNIPFGMIKKSDGSIVAASRIGDFAIDLNALQSLNYFDDLQLEEGLFNRGNLNDFIREGRLLPRKVRNRIAEIFDLKNQELASNEEHKSQILLSIEEVEPNLPVHIGDYTDFYSSKEHATNVGTMFRDPNNALLPNWLHIPVGYHGRSSSIIPSGQPIIRPKGQTRPNDEQPPVFGPTKLLDFELEMAFITCEGKPMGDSISTEEAENYIFGMVLFNDWSARDIQKWEYVPLGPFLAKNFASSISPWIVTLDALEPYKTATPVQDPEPLPYLHFAGDKSFDIELEVAIQPEDNYETTVCRSNHKHLYWNISQQLAHHTVNGCNVRAGDMMASGTISGSDEKSFGSMLEITWRGTKPVKMSDGSERKFINDGDTVIMRGHSEKNGVRIGFGEVRTKVLPAK
jgi:fumarylacetoacetase